MRRHMINKISCSCVLSSIINKVCCLNSVESYRYTNHQMLEPYLINTFDIQIHVTKLGYFDFCEG